MKSLFEIIPRVVLTQGDDTNSLSPEIKAFHDGLIQRHYSSIAVLFEGRLIKASRFTPEELRQEIRDLVREEFLTAFDTRLLSGETGPILFVLHQHQRSCLTFRQRLSAGLLGEIPPG